MDITTAIKAAEAFGRDSIIATGMSADDQADMRTTADAFRQAVGMGGFMTLGVSGMATVPGAHRMGGLLFIARVLPMTKTGDRAEGARLMFVLVSLTPADEIDIEVRHLSNGAKHAEARGIYIDQVQAFALALDYNGREVLNPRYWPQA